MNSSKSCGERGERRGANASSLIDDVVQQSERILTVAGSATLLDAPERQTC